MWGDHARESVAAQADRLIAARWTASFDFSCAKQSGTPTPEKKTWLASAGSTDRTAARSGGEGAPVGASIFPDNVNVGTGLRLRQDGSCFAELEFPSNLLHARGRNGRRVRQTRQLSTAGRCRTESIDDVKCVLHEISFRA